MSADTAPLDPVIHAQARLRIMATLAALPQRKRTRENTSHTY